MLISALVHQAIDAMTAGTYIEPVTELAGVGAQSPAQISLLRIHMPVGLVMMHGKRLHRRAGAGLGHITGLGYGPLEPPAKIR